MAPFLKQRIPAEVIDALGLKVGLHRAVTGKTPP